MHISLVESVKKSLHTFVAERKKLKHKISQTSVIEEALELKFALEDIDPKKHNALKESIERKFSTPKNVPFKSFYIFLYLLATKYPKEDCKTFWTETVYTSGIPKTHSEVFAEIQDDMKRLLK